MWAGFALLGPARTGEDPARARIDDLVQEARAEDSTVPLRVARTLLAHRLAVGGPRPG